MRQDESATFNVKPRPHVSGFVCIRKHFVAVTLSVHTYPANRKLLKAVSRVETFENATNPDTCGRAVYNQNDLKSDDVIDEN